jgi:hypothetical protein
MTSTKPFAARARMASLVAPIGSWRALEEIEDPRELGLEGLLKLAAERRELRRSRRLYAQLCHSCRQPLVPRHSPEWLVYRTLLYANGQHRLRLSGLVRRTGLPREELLACVRRLREQGYLTFGIERS